MEDTSNSESLICFYCHHQFNSLLYKFAPCNHNICISCLFQRIFLYNIQDFIGVEFIKVKCKCGKGELAQSLNDVSSLIIKKKQSDEKNKGKEIIEELKICEKHSNEYINSFLSNVFNMFAKNAWKKL